MNTTKMTTDMQLMPLSQPRRVLTRVHQHVEYTIRLTRLITEIDDFEEEIMALEEATENDIVIMQVSSPGGDLETCDFLCRRMQECRAPIVVEVGLMAASAASAIVLQADELIVHDSSAMLVHACSYSPGFGREADIFGAATYTNKMNREWLERTYSGFLTKEEIRQILDGKDLYLYADDLRERFPKYVAYREEQSQAKEQKEYERVMEILEQQEAANSVKKPSKKSAKKAKE